MQETHHDEAGLCHQLPLSTSLDSALETFKLTSDIQSYHLPVYSLLDPSEVPYSQGSTLPGLPICLAKPASLGFPNVAPLKCETIRNAVISYTSPGLNLWIFVEIPKNHSRGLTLPVTGRNLSSPWCSVANILETFYSYLLNRSSIHCKKRKQDQRKGEMKLLLSVTSQLYMSKTKVATEKLLKVISGLG